MNKGRILSDYTCSICGKDIKVFCAFCGKHIGKETIIGCDAGFHYCENCYRAKQIGLI